ncbi:MAG: glyoxylate/hydroxypyruvate reductase A [Rhodospirillaceae bacterium]|jgi:glyoxylate/hydroxypyruvate reductase|nr:glyoxylate/hydroxypyruvate reductase A [Rhodospirillaceae bacterium]
MTLLLKCEEKEQEACLAVLAEHLPKREVRVYPEVGLKEEIEYALVYAPPPGLLSSLPNLKAIFSRWAGIDHMASDPCLPPVPIFRTVDYNMVACMTVHVLQQVLSLHTYAETYRRQQFENHWKKIKVIAPEDRRVGILGLGALGKDVAEKISSLRFDVAGWSRSEKSIDKVLCLHGNEGLNEILARSDILICLLPLTSETKGILNAEHIASMPQGASIINCARGGHVVEKDLLKALQSGKISCAALDVFEEEPLPESHPFWAHPKIIVTPHIATPSASNSSIEAVVENIKRLENGQKPLNAVNVDLGY